MKKKLSSFFKIYIGVMAGLVALLVVAAVVLWTVLDAYETTRPKHVAEEVFNKYFLNSDIAGLMSAADPDSEDFESAETINSAAKELIDTEKLKYFAVTSDDKNSAKYAVTEDNNRIAYFTVRKTDKKGKYGFEFYELSYMI